MAHSGTHSGKQTNGELLISRRHFLYGALGAGALAAGLGSVARPGQAFADDEEVEYLEVPEESVFSHEPDCTLVPASELVLNVGTYELPYGTLIWANGDTVAACLFPTETAAPLTQAGILFLGNGSTTVVLEAALGTAQGFEIYDIRANEQGVVWTEANIFSNTWRIYAAPFNGEAIGEATMVDEGGSDWETPTIAAVGSHAFWQVLPHLGGEKTSEDSLLKRAAFNGGAIDTVYASEGRMSTPVYPLKDSLVITPRTSTDAIHHQLTLIEAATGAVKDTLVLPPSMKPLEAGYGSTGFTFSFDDIYSYGGGISNLGTYAPQSAKAVGNYQNQTWFHFVKSPTAPPSWCRNFFVVKSSRSVCGVDLNERKYFALDVENGSDSYGDYLASTGINGSIVTYANIDTQSTDGTTRKCCLVRIWAPFA
ncbi:MAG: twin-arginine translocation signal domain-containing protein [Eggerthellaceae bacterium]|nr:twin-arginine translocation signal domain-containing protein [Eggerthellaceae bacterium]MDR2715215.1 twin-arginine translocation signal domain-containing protein [Coriobacteriaceae bacterium]